LIEKTLHTTAPSYTKSLISSYIHKVVYLDGSYAYVSGICTNIEQAKGNRAFLIDCKIGKEMKIVFISPKEIKIIEE
jgi:hypothetical protein